jgi:RNA polymerase sigma-70 factor (ECF subfamily)
MASSPMSNVLEPLYRAALLRDGAGLTDAELLEGFIVRRDATYFEALVRRHGPMVLGVCQRVLRNPHDAEDAFQAAFLVLAQRAAAVVPHEMVGNWLYGVAYRTAMQARRTAARRRTRERQVNDMPQPRASDEETWQELLPLLDRELDRLPNKYRAAVVLCHLEGRTRKEAASQLGLPVGTLSGRLTTALRMLAKRLRRHGLALSVGALAAALTPKAASASIPASLVGATVKAAPLLAAGQAASAGIVSAEVAGLTKGVLRSMLLARLKTIPAVLLVVAALGGGTAVFAYRTQAVEQGNVPQAELPQVALEPEKIRPQEQPQAADQLADQKTVQKKSDRDWLQGSWVPIASAVAGMKKRPDDPKLQQWNLTFDGDQVILNEKKTVAYTLDPEKQPKEMDIMVEVDGDLMKAIYEFDGPKVLKLSWKKNGERPTDFDTARNESVLIIFGKKGKSKP